MMDFDIIVVGAGHNGLITAAYLAQAGYKVCVFEKRHIVGGAVSTEEIIPGYQFDLGGSAHILIRLTPIIDELELEKYGLEYIELDPLFFSPFEDGDAFFIYRDIERTIDHLELKFPGEGEAYRKFVNDWMGFSTAVCDAFLSAPSPFELGKKFIKRKTGLNWKIALPRIMRPYGDVVREYFNEEKVRAMLVWMAAQSGPPPSEPMSAPMLFWHPLYHKGGIARPRGGSGMLTQALKRHIVAHGGTVLTGAPVNRILVERHRVVGVQLKAETYTSKVVVSAVHIEETFRKLLSEEYHPPQAKGIRVGNGFGLMVRLALNKPVSYAAHPGEEARIALQLICNDTSQIQNAYGDYLRGNPASDPPLVAMTFSAVDNSLAPAGGEVLWLWGQYFPYALSGGRNWGECEDVVVENILNTFERFAPGTKQSIVGQLFQSPVWLERELGLLRGNVMHLEMSIDQMFMFRPFLGMSNYRTHIEGLFLTGASTHPGGGIMGASGRNAARVILKDLNKSNLWSSFTKHAS